MASKTSPKSKIAEARRLYEKIYTLLDSAVQDAARQVMVDNPMAYEYVQAMGTWSFSVRVVDVEGDVHEVDASSWDNLKRFFHSDYLSPSGMKALKKLGDAIEAFTSNVMDAYADLLESRVTPMRFSARGKVVTDW